MKADPLFTLVGYFAAMSLFAIGGGMAVIPEFQRIVVDVEGWMTARQFNDLFAIAQLSPGPNILIVTLIGYHVAGLAGAGAATLAICGPTCLFAYFFGRFWDRFEAARWRVIVQAALVPLSIGLLGASAWVIASTVATSWVAIALMFAAAALSFWSSINPLWVFVAGAILGLVGLL